MKITIFNGAGQVDYMYGLVSGLSQFQQDSIDVLDVDITKNLFRSFKNVNYYPVFRFIPRKSFFLVKGWNIIRFYFLQLWYLMSNSSRIIHFQWLDRYIFIDRVMLPLIARICGHKVVLTVHNINSAKRDNRDNWFNRFTLKVLYMTANALIVHTDQSKIELLSEFQVKESKIFIIRHGMNNKVSRKGLTTRESRSILNIGQHEKVVLFFGNIDFYKGLDILIDSLNFLPKSFKDNFRVLIAGSSKKFDYTNLIKDKITNTGLKQNITIRIGYIPDSEIEQYFMAADCIVMPYRKIYQSGVIFMAYAFGLPIIVTDIGNFRNDMIEGETGILIKENTPEGVSLAIIQFFNSEIFKKMPESRKFIEKWAWNNYSWDSIGAETRKLYQSLSKSL
ncbi:MAG: glycosyltransferase [Lentimicrobium sp.]